MAEWIHLRAPNDTNGNPRRLYVKVSQGEVQTVADEGYRGIAAAREAGCPTHYTPPMFDIPASEYRILRNWKGGRL